jgi:nucleoside-diphosphate-sugar epimerase
MAERGVVLYPGVSEHWLSLLHVDDVVDGLLAAARRDTSIPRTFFLSSSEPVQWRALGEQIAASVGRRARHVNVPSSLVRTASFAGEWIGKLTGSATLANTSKAELSRHPYWVCSGRRAEEELHFRPTRSLPRAIQDTYLWYRQNGWMRGSRRADSAVA